jgi:hypothetical protein
LLVLVEVLENLTTEQFLQSAVLAVAEGCCHKHHNHLQLEPFTLFQLAGVAWVPLLLQMTQPLEMVKVQNSTQLPFLAVVAVDHMATQVQAPESGIPPLQLEVEPAEFQT